MCSAPGRVSAITPGREISTAQQESLWIDTTNASRAQSSKCGDFPESANTPRTRWPASRSIELFQSSRLTLLAFWPGFLTFANPSIPLSLGKSFGNTPQFFFQNPRPRPSTQHSSVYARSKHSAAQKNPRLFRSKNPVVRPNYSSKPTP